MLEMIKSYFFVYRNNSIAPIETLSKVRRIETRKILFALALFRRDVCTLFNSCSVSRGTAGDIREASTRANSALIRFPPARA